MFSIYFKSSSILTLEIVTQEIDWSRCSTNKFSLSSILPNIKALLMERVSL